MMVIGTGELLQVQIHLRTIGYCIEEFLYHLCIKISNPLCCQVQIINKIWSSGKVDRTHNKRFIHRKKEITETLNGFFISKRTFDRFSENNSRIFYRMMAIHIQITLYGQIQIKKSVLGKACQHMIEKSDTGIDLCISLSIQI